MKRTDAPDAAPGNLFTDGDSAVPTRASVLDASWLNAVQEEIVSVITAAAIALNAGDNTQLLQAIQRLIAVGQHAFWCGTSTGTTGAQVVASPDSLLALPDGTALSWKIGAGLTNVGAVGLTVGTFGAFAVRKDSPTGPIALTGGELVAGNIAIARIDGATLQLVATELGSAALANASSHTGIVAAVSGAVVVGNLPVFSDAFGTQVDSGASPGSLNGAAPGILYQLGLTF